MTAVLCILQAYKNFGQRVNNQRKKLEEHKKGLPSPIPSPSHDAPSPGNTPPHIAQQYDNTDTVDMDLSDDEGNKWKCHFMSKYQNSIVNANCRWCDAHGGKVNCL